MSIFQPPMLQGRGHVQEMLPGSQQNQDYTSVTSTISFRFKFFVIYSSVSQPRGNFVPPQETFSNDWLSQMREEVLLA